MMTGLPAIADYPWGPCQRAALTRFSWTLPLKLRGRFAGLRNQSTEHGPNETKRFEPRWPEATLCGLSPRWLGCLGQACASVRPKTLRAQRQATKTGTKQPTKPATCLQESPEKGFEARGGCSSSEPQANHAAEHTPPCQARTEGRALQTRGRGLVR